MRRSATDLLKLGILDSTLRMKQQPSIFKTSKQKLRFARNMSYRDTLKAAVSGLHEVKIIATGKTKGGYAFRRQRRFNIRT